MGVLLLFASIGVFGMSPTRYGQESRGSTMASSSPLAEPDPLPVVELSGPRPAIDAGDPSDV